MFPSSTSGRRLVASSNFTLRLILCATHDSHSSLRHLRGLASSIIRFFIWPFLDYRNFLKFGSLGSAVDRSLFYPRAVLTSEQTEIFDWFPACDKVVDPTANLNSFFYPICRNVKFPPPSDIEINMMPFILGNSNSIPKEYHGYLSLIELASNNQDDNMGEVCYLTIQEGWVEAGNCQRRLGLHVEATQPVHTAKINRWYWGEGALICKSLVGGIIHGSTVSETCELWDAQVSDPVAVGPLGSLEHLRGSLGPGYKQPANELVWFTDMTPHEALPVFTRSYRQYFRLVFSKVSVWYSRHNTRNPLGIKPPDNVIISDQDKFEE
jgi:hypothetical protein